MKLKVRVENQPFTISVGIGLNDIAWLALAAAKLYGKSIYPHGNYIPVLLKCKDYCPHPRSKIHDVIKDITNEKEEKDKEKERDDSHENWIWDVWIKLPNMKWTEEHQTWFDQAFGKERNKMDCDITWNHEIRQPAGQDKKTIFGQSIKINYKIFNEVCYEFNPRDYQTQYNLQFVEQQENHAPNTITMHAQIKLPLGDITFENNTKHVTTINYFIKNSEGENEPKNYAIDKTNDSAWLSCIPIPMAQADIWKAIKDQKKQIETQLQKEAKEEKTDDLGSSLCPYNFETIWKVVLNSQENDQNYSLDGFESNVDEKIKGIVTENLNKLYEIFLQYSFLYQQKSEKRDEICITVQDVMHFLKFYQICHDNQVLFENMENYDIEKKLMNNFKVTMDINHGIKFPEFILIILKNVLYLQQLNILSESEEYAKILSQVLKNIFRIDSNEEEMNEFQKHMKFNFTLINYIRENSEKFINVFLSKVQESMQVAERKFHMVREDIRTIIIESGFKGENLEDIITSCFHELYLDAFQGHDEIFYFEFLQILQWLSLVLVSDSFIKDDEKEDEELEEGIEGLIEKLKFFMSQIKV